MLNWLKLFLQESPVKSLSAAALLSMMNWMGNLVIALSDGKLDGAEMHNLSLGANSIEMAILFAVMFYLNKPKS